MKCQSCGANSRGEALFCHRCGNPLSAGYWIECEKHAGVRATAVCVVCGKPVCADCSSSVEGKTYCDDASHVRLGSTHRLLGFSPYEFEAELVAQNLRAGGIQVLVFPLSAYFRSAPLTAEERTAIYALTEDIAGAKRIIGEGDLQEFITFGEGIT